MFEVYEYNNYTRLYFGNGRSGLLKSKCLIANVDNEIVLEDEKILHLTIAKLLHSRNLYHFMMILILILACQSRMLLILPQFWLPILMMMSQIHL